MNFIETISWRGYHSTLIRSRCDNILRWRIKSIFIYHVYAKGDCAKCEMHTGAKSYSSSFVFTLHWNRNTFFLHHNNRSDNSLWSSIFGETYEYCLLLVYVIDPGWQNSSWDDSLLDKKKVQRSNRKALLFEVHTGK